MGNRMKWESARRNPRGYEDAEPRQPAPARGGSHVKPAPVRTFKEMTPEEQRALLELYERR